MIRGRSPSLARRRPFFGEEETRLRFRQIENVANRLTGHIDAIDQLSELPNESNLDHWKNRSARVATTCVAVVNRCVGRIVGSGRARASVRRRRL